MKLTSLLLGLSASLFTVLPVSAKTVEVNFSQGSYCGDYSVHPEDIMTLKASEGQWIEVTPISNIQLVSIHNYAGELMTTESGTETYYKGTYVINPVPYSWYHRMVIRLCVYTINELPEDRD